MNFARHRYKTADFIRNIDAMQFEYIQTAQYHDDEIKKSYVRANADDKQALNYYAKHGGALQIVSEFAKRAVQTAILTPAIVRTHLEVAALTTPGNVMDDYRAEDFDLADNDIGCLRVTLDKYLGRVMFDLSEDYFDKSLFSTVKHLPHNVWVSSVALTRSVIDDLYQQNKVSPAFEQLAVCHGMEQIIKEGQHGTDGLKPLSADVRDRALLPMDCYFAVTKLILSKAEYNNMRVRQLAQENHVSHHEPNGIKQMPSLN